MPWCGRSVMRWWKKYFEKMMKNEKWKQQIPEFTDFKSREIEMLLLKITKSIFKDDMLLMPQSFLSPLAVFLCLCVSHNLAWHCNDVTTTWMASAYFSIHISEFPNVICCAVQTKGINICRHLCQSTDHAHSYPVTVQSWRTSTFIDWVIDPHQITRFVVFPLAWRVSGSRNARKPFIKYFVAYAFAFVEKWLNE